jgi:hypothetical protein
MALPPAGEEPDTYGLRHRRLGRVRSSQPTAWVG